MSASASHLDANYGVQPVTIGEALHDAAKRLSVCSTTARLDAEVLLAHVLGLSRAQLLARLNHRPDAEQLARLEELVRRRQQGEPVAYLTGHREFFGLDLFVTPDVLVPRPETESLVEACLELLPPDQPRLVADVGTGSGAIAVALAVHRPLARVYATDISCAALAVAERNCRKHDVQHRVVLLPGDLLAPLPERVHIIAANLPYVPEGEASPEVAMWEPHVAVFGGGQDGTDLIRRFLAQAPHYLLPGGAVVMETAHSQGALVAELARSAFDYAGVNVELRKDLAGYDRIVVLRS
jgi:release factor glutamine methyltransferase